MVSLNKLKLRSEQLSHLESNLKFELKCATIKWSSRLLLVSLGKVSAIVAIWMRKVMLLFCTICNKTTKAVQPIYSASQKETRDLSIFYFFCLFFLSHRLKTIEFHSKLIIRKNKKKAEENYISRFSNRMNIEWRKIVTHLHSSFIFWKSCLSVMQQKKKGEKLFCRHRQ